MSRRFRFLTVCFLSLALTLGATWTVGAQDNGQGQGQGQGQGPDNGAGNGQGNTAPDNNTTSEPGPPDHAQGQSARERAQADRQGLDNETIRQERSAGLENKYSNWQRHLTPEQRGNTGMLFAQDENFTGTFVSFQLDQRRALVHNVTLTNGTPLFDEIWLPLSDQEAVARLTGNALRIDGPNWTFHIHDAASVPIKFDGDGGERFVLRLPNGTQLERDTRPQHRIQLLYPGDDDTTIRGHIMHDVAQDAVDPAVLVVNGSADFYVAAQYVALPHVANKARSDLDAALQDGRLGAELTVLRTPEAEVYEETVLYEDMTLAVAPGTATGETTDGNAFTITVDAHLSGGRTIAVTFQQGLLDPETLRLRYFSVDPNRTVEAPIVAASDIHDVLDPNDDGTITEYWIVEDIDGVQVLLSIPHFSVHQIELLSLVEIERPALVFGILGAVVLVAVATRGLLRRPQDV